VDYTEFHKKMREKYAQDQERLERRWQRRRRWLYRSLTFFAAIVLALIAALIAIRLIQ